MMSPLATILNGFQNQNFFIVDTEGELLPSIITCYISEGSPLR